MKLKNLKIKVCGMRDPDNIRAVASLDIDYIGFIFYKGSPRYAGRLSPHTLADMPPAIRKVGVFVDENPCLVAAVAKKFNLDYVQLHGDETPEYCMHIRKEIPGIKIIKAFGVKEPPDHALLQDYEEVADLFLFDTFTPQHGGSGKTFDKSLLREYRLDKPFLLSGGIDENIAAELAGLDLPQLHALDINSRFEHAPGNKDIQRIRNFINTIRS